MWNIFVARPTLLLYSISEYNKPLLFLKTKFTHYTFTIILYFFLNKNNERNIQTET